ncbi:MAG: Holliday junction resolvase RuvX [Planctomycetota bacterium]
MTKTLGIDYGSKRIGLSVSVPLLGMAVGYDVIEMNDSLSNNIKEIVIKEKIESIVIGLPKRMDNTLGQSAQAVMKFSEELKKILNIPVILWDERLTSKQAEMLLRDVNISHKDKRQQINITSAQLMLQSYMDAQTVK